MGRGPAIPSRAGPLDVVVRVNVRAPTAGRNGIRAVPRTNVPLGDERMMRDVMYTGAWVIPPACHDGH